ncbi:MAG TPA: hypothetical protein VFP59_03330 [Candidatus Angelobacter sp.]|nr:hypothetical protein [Candidatus Angelobacter sp.]
MLMLREAKRGGKKSTAKAPAASFQGVNLDMARELAILIALCVLFQVCAVAVARNSEDERAVKDFHDRVVRYVAAHKVQHTAVKPSDSGVKLSRQERQAAREIQQSRAAAKQGDIFTPRISAYFRKQLAATLHGPEGAKIRTSLRSAEPLPNIHLRVNEKYPPDLPLQSTPPTLLLNLPRLPQELEYRIVGQTLVLYEPGPNLIVDLLPNAIPKH